MFINKDPIEEQGGLNLYAFVRNSAVNRFDVLGLDEFDPINTVEGRATNFRPTNYRPTFGTHAGGISTQFFMAGTVTVTRGAWDSVNPDGSRGAGILGTPATPDQVAQAAAQRNSQNNPSRNHSGRSPKEGDTQQAGNGTDTWTLTFHENGAAGPAWYNDADVAAGAVSTVTGRMVPGGAPIAGHGFPGDPVFAAQAGTGGLIVASVVVPGGAALALARTATGRLILYTVGLGQFVANPDDPINAVGVLPVGMGIGIVRNGRVVIADLTVATSHQALAAQAGVLRANGTLADGAQAITWVVKNGRVRTWASINFPSQTGAATDDIVKQYLQALAKANGGGGG